MSVDKYIKWLVICCLMPFCMASCIHHGLCDIVGIEKLLVGVENEHGRFVTTDDSQIPADKVALLVRIEWFREKITYDDIDFLKSPIKDYSVWIDFSTGESEDITSKVEPHGAPAFPMTQWWPNSFLEFRFIETPPTGVYRFRVQLNVDDGRQFAAETEEIEIIDVSE